MKELHNQMEERVTAIVNEIFSEEENTHRHGFCVCRQCRLDVACYVLNRLSPRYVVSGRGIAHVEADYAEKLQEEADIVALVREGVSVVSHTRRPNFDHLKSSEIEPPEGPLYNFPILKGNLLVGDTFEPAAGVEILLLCEGKPAPGMNPNWQNPYPIPEKVPGTFVFWQRPISAKSPGEERTFELELKIEDPGYEECHHFLTLSLKSEASFINALHSDYRHEIEDIYLFPK